MVSNPIGIMNLDNDTLAAELPSSAPSTVTESGTERLTSTLQDSTIDTSSIREGLTVETPQSVNDTTSEWPTQYESTTSIVNTSVITDTSTDAPDTFIHSTADNYTDRLSNTIENATWSFDNTTQLEEENVGNSSLPVLDESTENVTGITSWDVTEEVTTPNDFLENVTLAAEEVTSQTNTEQTLSAVSEFYNETSDYWDITNDTSLVTNETSRLVNDTSFDLGFNNVINNGTDLSTSPDLLTEYSTGDWNVSTESLVSSSLELLENVTATASSLLENVTSSVLENVTESEYINASLLEDGRYFVTYDWLDGNQSTWLDSNQSDIYVDRPHYVYSLQYYLGEMIVVTILLGILTLWTIIGNFLVLISLVKFKNLKTMSNYLIGNLALCDFLLALTVLPLSLINDVLGHWLFGEVLCNIWLSIDVLYCTASIWSLCVIALDRFTATTFPVWYRDKRSLNRAMWYIALVWIFSIFVTVPPLFGWQDRSLNYQYSNTTMTYHCILFQNIEYVIYSAHGSFIIPLFLMLVLYLKIFMVLRKRSRQLNRAYQRNQPNRRIPSKKGKPERDRHPPQDIELSTISKGEDSKFLFTYSTDSSPDPDMKSEDEDILSSHDGSRLNSPNSVFEKDNTSVRLIKPHIRNGLLSTTEATDSDTMVISNPTSRFTSVNSDKESQSDLETVKLVQAQHDQKNHDHSPNPDTDDGQGKKQLSVGIKGANPFKRDRLRSSFRKFDKREQRATKRMGMIISCFFVCWIPFTLMYMIRALCTYCPELNPNLQAFIIWLGYANSGLNPLLYTIFNEDFRKAFIKLVCCCWPWALKVGKVARSPR